MLVVGADLLVRGASKLALSFGISPLVVGLTIVAFGTSAPEVAVSVGAVLDGQTDIAIGNVVGSNIFNVLFILGAERADHAAGREHPVDPAGGAHHGRRQPAVVGAGLDGRLSMDGALLFALVLAYTVFLVVQSRARDQGREGRVRRRTAPPRQAPGTASCRRSWRLIAVGLVALVLGSDWLVTAAVAFAKAMGVSDLVIGLTIVAAGTSHARGGHLDHRGASRASAISRWATWWAATPSTSWVAWACPGWCRVMLGLVMAPALLYFDIWVMLAVALACLPVFMTGREIARWEGGVFLGYYAAYVTYLILAAQQHDALGTLTRGVMMSFVVPLTVVTLVVMLIRRPAAVPAQ